MKNRPFLKWAGGKFKLIDKIHSLFPKSYGRYVEPFVGAASVALNTNGNITINDINCDLIECYMQLQNNATQFIENTQKLFVSENNNKQRYFELRKHFNELSSNNMQRASLFVYLNRHCFNGLCRYNASGKFNTSFGKYKHVFFPKTELENCSKIIKNWQITNTSYINVLNSLAEGDVCYCDPPYAPLSETSNFTNYSTNSFSQKDQIELAKTAYEAAKEKNAFVLISNHNVDFIRELYQSLNAKIIIIDVRRSLAGNADKRKKVSELIAIFDPLNCIDIHAKH